MFLRRLVFDQPRGRLSHRCAGPMCRRSWTEPPRVGDGMSMVSIHQILSATRMAKIDHMSALLMVHHVFLATVTSTN